MTKYLIDNEAVEESEFWDKLDLEVRYEVEEHLDDLIDELYEEVHIGCCTFSPSTILEKCDPIAYSMIGDDFIEQRLEDNKYDLNRGDCIDVNGYEFEIVEEDDEEEEE